MIVEFDIKDEQGKFASRMAINQWDIYDKIGYECKHPTVRDMHNADMNVIKTKVCIGPRRTTKSYSAAHDIMPLVFKPVPFDEPVRIWFVGPSYYLAAKEFQYCYDSLVMRRDKLGLKKASPCYNSPSSGKLFMHFCDTSRFINCIIEGKSADRPDSLLGEAVDAIVYCEAAQLKAEIRSKYCRPTLNTKGGVEIIPTTPEDGCDWLFELDTKGNDPNYPAIQSYHWDVTANPKYDMAEFERAKLEMGEDNPLFKEQYLGEWVFYTGRVYPTFQEESHVIDPFHIPSHWKRIRGIDFGHKDPFVCLTMAVGPCGELYLYEEYYYIPQDRALPEHAEHIKGMSEISSLPVADPSGSQAMEDLSYYGINCIPANNERQAGRLRVAEYLNPSPDGHPPYGEVKIEGMKYPRLYIFRGCEWSIKELKYLRWADTKRSEGVKEKTEGADHAADVIRYLCMTRPSPSRLAHKAPANSPLWLLNQMRRQRRNNPMGKIGMK